MPESVTSPPLNCRYAEVGTVKTRATFAVADEFESPMLPERIKSAPEAAPLKVFARKTSPAIFMLLAIVTPSRKPVTLWKEPVDKVPPLKISVLDPKAPAWPT